jgi:hypothetical protein
MKIIRADYWEKPGEDWLCGVVDGQAVRHLFESVPILDDRFRILRCKNCGLIDPCECPVEYLDLAGL